VLNRKELHVASFWQFQIIGWGGFYLLVLVASLPFVKKQECCETIPCSLRRCLSPVVCCVLFADHSATLARVFALEARAFAWSLLVGISAAFVLELVTSGFQENRLDRLVGTSVEYSVVLLLWCSLYFSIKQWRQSAEERQRLLPREAEAREARLSALRYQLNRTFCLIL